MKTAKEYVDGLSSESFVAVKSLENSPNFYQFLAAAPKDDVMATASLKMQCQSAGVPEDYTKSAEALHYLVIAINDRLKGNA